jgi:aldehyde:ferredoxin oxidoreductase
MDCAERGLIDSPLRFGDSEGQIALTEDIAYGRGLGAALGQGIARAAKAWGIDEALVPVFAVKNLEYPAYDPRGSVGMALAYATSDRGGCHMRSWPIAVEALSEDKGADPFGGAGKAAFVAGEQDENAAEWSLVGCDFIGYTSDDAAAMLAAVGIEMTADEYLALGRRVWNLVRLFNLKQGWTAADDSMPKGLEIPLTDSGRSLDPALFAQMKKEYYEVRGWDAQGRPTAELVRELGLGGYA